MGNKNRLDEVFFDCTKCGTELHIDTKVCTNCGFNYNILVKPWTRWFARMFDYWIYALIIGAILALIAPSILEINGIYLYMLITFISVFLETIFLIVCGTTPGKYLLNIQLIPSNQKKFTGGLALNRSLRVWIQGVGFGFPIVTLFLYINWYFDLKRKRITSWDKATQVQVIHKKDSTVKLTIFILLLLIMFFLNGYLVFAGITNYTFF